MTDTTTEALRKRVIRERKTEQRLRGMDTHELVALVHSLEDEREALAQERDAAFRRGMLHACDIACDVMQRAAKFAREPDLIPNIRREFLAQARGVEDAIDAIRLAAKGERT